MLRRSGGNPDRKSRPGFSHLSAYKLNSSVLKTHRSRSFQGKRNAYVPIGMTCDPHGSWPSSWHSRRKGLTMNMVSFHLEKSWDDLKEGRDEKTWDEISWRKLRRRKKDEKTWDELRWDETRLTQMRSHEMMTWWHEKRCEEMRWDEKKWGEMRRDEVTWEGNLKRRDAKSKRFRFTMI